MKQRLEDELGFGYRVRECNRTDILEQCLSNTWVPLASVVELRYLVGARHTEEGYHVTLHHCNGTHCYLRVEDASEVMVVLKGWVRQYWENKE